MRLRGDGSVDQAGSQGMRRRRGFGGETAGGPDALSVGNQGKLAPSCLTWILGRMVGGGLWGQRCGG